MINRSIAYQRVKIQLKPVILFVAALIYMGALSSCNEQPKNSRHTSFNYQHFKDSVLNTDKGDVCDAENCLDDENFVPGRDSTSGFFERLESNWKEEEAAVAKNSLPLQKAVQANLSALRAFRYGFRAGGGCRQQECPLYAEVDKSEQVLHLYVDGELVDTYPVSTGIKGRETPSFSVRPSGPIFTKYTSKKFPGGNYKGLGNMPYAVFVKGGYAIHGTTPGNFRRLGIRASHGCIRLHPDNAKVFTELVKQYGLGNTWVTVKP
ncbi:L,D-transpeptidase [Polluticoccus soli]|uniref:L,D-transpeptidase n=1 Tax=Polluticoccus soli TaxID=3034150 RepID=UPI0023E17962|nr:L,D-transpeptidase [Flavipsychrobacter sp. JY13-12]